MRKAIDMLAQVDVSKVPLAVPAAIGVLRCALDVESAPQGAPSQQAAAVRTWRERIGAGEDFPLHGPTDVETAMVAEIAELRVLSAGPPAKPDGLTDEQLEAARYRWLRDKSEPGICAFYLSVGKAFHEVKFKPETVDEAIDAQIHAQQTKKGDEV